MKGKKKNPMQKMMEESENEISEDDLLLEFDIRDVVIATFMKIMEIENRVKKLEERLHDDNR